MEKVYTYTSSFYSIIPPVECCEGKAVSKSDTILSSSCCSPRKDVAHSRGEWVPLDEVISCNGRVFTACDLVLINGEAVHTDKRVTKQCILCVCICILCI